MGMADDGRQRGDTLRLLAAADYRGRAQDTALLGLFDAEVERLAGFTGAVAAHEAETQAVMAHLKQAATTVLQRKLTEALRRHSVMELSEFPLAVTPGTIRLLRAAGVETLADLARFRGKWALTEIRGIGEVKSQEIQAAYATIRAAVRKEASITLAPPFQPDEVALLGALQQLQLLIIAGRGLVKHEATAQTATELLERVGTADQVLRSPLARLFPNTTRKVTARQDLAALTSQIMRLVTRPSSDLYTTFQQRLAAQRAESGAQTIADFEAEPAAFFSLLARYMGEETVGGPVAPGEAGAQESTQEALWRSVMALELDLDGLKAILRPYQEFGARFLAHQHHTILGRDAWPGATRAPGGGATECAEQLDQRDPQAHHPAAVQAAHARGQHPGWHRHHRWHL